MATDFAVAYFFLPVLIGIGVLVFLAVAGGKRPPSSALFLGLGRKRLAFGYLGALITLLIYCAIDSYSLGRTKVSLGHVSAAEAHQLLLGWTLYLFILTTPFVVFFLTVVGLPALAGLRRIGFVSLAGCVAVSQLVAVILSIWPAVAPYNQWCATHRWQCVGGSFSSAAILGATIAIGFALAARLPLVRRSAS